MNEIYIAGIGQTAVKEHWDVGLRELSAAAIREAMRDAKIEKIDALFVGNMLSGVLSGQEHLGALVAEAAGLQGVEAVKVEAACGSGAAAFRQAVFAVASGMVENAVAVGVEKLTEKSGYHTTAGLASAADSEYETSIGLSFVGINALLMRRYMYEFGYQKDDFAVFGIQSHDNAYSNPNAMFRSRISQAQYNKSKMIADPVNLLDSSPIGDGSAAVVVSKKTLPNSIKIIACEIATDTVALHNRKNLLQLSGVEKSAAKAFKSAGLSHKYIDFFELHDAFSIMAALSLEASGFCEFGTAVKIANENKFSINGDLPICTFGGLKGRGHPVGATGLYQIVEAVSQLRGDAPEQIQLDKPKTAMTQNIGGSGATVITTILSRR